MRLTSIQLRLALGLFQASLAADPGAAQPPAGGTAAAASPAVAASPAIVPSAAPDSVAAPAPASVAQATAAPAEGAPVPGQAADTAALPVLPAPAAAARDSVHKVVEPAVVEAPGLAGLKVGGTFQLKASYQDMTADEDRDKRLGFELRRARLDLAGALGDHFSFEGQFSLEGNGRQLGAEAVYLAWKLNDFFGIKGGKLKRPFSQEALSSSKGLYTVERTTLYHDFLANTTGYSSYDLGLLFHGGFEDEGVPVTYEAGIFNGKQTNNPATAYAGQHYEARDAGFKAKDFGFRIQVQPFRPLKVEGAISTKAAEDTTDPANFDYHVNTAYEVGVDLNLAPLRLLGEIAWGDNHQGRDSRIISGSSLFMAFYAMAVWHEDYSRGRASELVLRIEGQDPDFEVGSGEGGENDGRLRYTAGANYFFAPRVSVLVDYTLLQPITEMPGEDELVHGLEAMWRMSF